MIRCPECGGDKVHEDRHVPLPSGQNRLLRWLKRAWIPIQFVVALLAVAGVFVLMGWVSSLLPQEEGGEGGWTDGCVICGGTTLLYLFPYAFIKITRSVVSALTRLQRWLSGPADELPRLYWRTCLSCGLEWTRRAGDPPHRVRIRRAGVRGEEQARSLEEQARRRLHRLKGRAYQPFLDRLASHWNGTHSPSPSFGLETPDEAAAFFRGYRRAMGEEPEMRAGHQVTGFVRNTPIMREDALLFARAYCHLERGERADAARRLRDLAGSRPTFADAWLWSSATVDEQGERLACLERAVRLEPAHPLALDALAIARGEVLPGDEPGKSAEVETVIVRCPRCGGGLRHEPGAGSVACRYCDHRMNLGEPGAPGREAPLVTTLRLQRRLPRLGGGWAEARHAVRCQSCGARMAMARRLAAACAYCGSTNVLAADDPLTLQQPDGVLPFQVGYSQAAAALRASTKRGIEIGTPRGLYVPFWAFDGAVEVRWLRDVRGQAPTSDRERRITFDDLLFPAVNVPPPSVLDEAGPFRLWKQVPYEPHVLADWPAQLYDLDVELAVEDAYDTMLALAHRRSGPAIKVQVVKDESGGRPAAGDSMRTFQVSQVTYRLLLVPLWAAPVRYRGQRDLALVNGQTGRMIIPTGLSGGR